MKKGIARLGLICSFNLFTSPVLASNVSDLLISEVMSNPSALPDSAGEWFELYNPTGHEINLRGIDLGDDGSNRHRFASDLLILPQQYLTLARGSAPGFAPDYVYNNFILSNSSDEIVFRNALIELLRLDYGPGFSAAGRSRELRRLPIETGSYDLTLAALTYGTGDIGTPGTAGSVSFALPAAVPVPAAIWLFISGLLAVLLPRATNVIPMRRTAAFFNVIPAQAGTSKIPVASNTRLPAMFVSNKSLQS
jgi:hypothetical protein